MGKDNVFEGYKIAVSNKLGDEKKELIDKITSSGGIQSRSVTSKVNYFICDKEEYEEGSGQISTAQRNNAHIVTKEFIYDCVSSGEIPPDWKSKYLMNKNDEDDNDNNDNETSGRTRRTRTRTRTRSGNKRKINSEEKEENNNNDDNNNNNNNDNNDGPPPHKRTRTRTRTRTSSSASSSNKTDEEMKEENEENEEEEENNESNSKPKSTKKIQFTGRAPVDEGARGIAGSGAYVVEEGDDIWDAHLSQSDVSYGVQGHNKYYVIQLIKMSSGNYLVFNKWGRTGAKGQTKKVQYSDLEAAKNDFRKKFHAKTGNHWENRRNFVKKAQKYTFVEMDYSADENDREKKLEKLNQKGNSSNSSKPVESKLSSPVQDLVSLISNISTMNSTMKEFEIDLDKMPLGQLSKRQIKKGYEILKEIQETISSGSRYELSDLSSEFYSEIPHDFGRRKPPLIDTEKKLKAKMEMLEALGDMEIAASILENTDEKHPLDSTYDKLKCGITPLDKNSDEFKMIEKYVSNTHGPTHKQYYLTVDEVFVMDRENEKKRYEKFQNYPNRQLLWHGSRLTNYMGIISQGLRIAPPEAPATGYMFGKGVYFADMVTKSANYCRATPGNDTGLMLLCEVALGEPYKRLGAEYVTKLPNGTSSTWGQGRLAPDPKDTVTLEDGVKVPVGKPQNTNVPQGSPLQYNEFIVYDVSQIYMKYLIKVKFNFKRHWF